MEEYGIYSCDTTLSLGMKHAETKDTRIRHDVIMPREPILSLGFSGSTCLSVNELSFSKTSHIVRQRDSLDEKETAARKKLRLSKDQLTTLETAFRLETTINLKQKHALARKLNLKPRQVEVWIQNRRARIKNKQAKVDRDFLREYYQVLSSENQRLKEEIKELKAEISCTLTYQYGAVTNPAAAGVVTNSVKLCSSCKSIGVNACVKLELVGPS
ncbi:Homeobox associated leucine zipper protein [Rhynchospora pubera]|uniref:Homeobox associated leucine zipper protein n=1 Tax=Rhynchospora pubera TaxID=906938 RepID=A0AAV8GMU3_9POAL|nr:Homeobox associated leucine zipper protein [Rhynchospora pubera]